MITKKGLKEVFHFKRFDIHQTGCPVKVGTDGVLLAAWTRIREAQSALDIGTGTGVIAVMLAQRGSRLQKIAGVEIDRVAWKTATINAAECPWAGRIRMYHTSIQKYAEESPDRYDLIVSNPPFFKNSTLSQKSDRNRIRHTISLTFEDLLNSVEKLLALHGFFNIILPGTEGREFINIAENYGLYLTRKTEVFSIREKPVERMLLEFSRRSGSVPERNELVIHRSKDRGFTEEYRRLTCDFYLKF